MSQTSKGGTIATKTRATVSEIRGPLLIGIRTQDRREDELWSRGSDNVDDVDLDYEPKRAYCAGRCIVQLWRHSRSWRRSRVLASLNSTKEGQQVHRCAETNGHEIQGHCLDEFAARHDAKSEDGGNGDQVSDCLIGLCDGRSLVHGYADCWRQ